MSPDKFKLYPNSYVRTVNYFTDIEWWMSATLSDLKSEILRGNSPIEQIPNHNLVTTPLHLAAAYADESLVEYLLDLGADPNAFASYGVRPIHEAAYFRKLQNIRLLHERGADLSITHCQAITPMSALEYSFRSDKDLRSVMTLVELDPDAFSSTQYNTVLRWMKDYGLKSTNEYRRLDTIFRRRKQKEKIQHQHNQRINPKPKEPVISADGAKTVLNWVLIVVGLMLLVGIFGGGEHTYDPLYDDSRALRRR